MAKQVNSTYGDALFQLAVEENQVDSILEELIGMIQVLNENEEMIRLLTHPDVKKEDKIKFVTDVFTGKVSDAVMGTMLIIVKNDRSKDMQAILEYVIARIKAYKKIGTAYVSSAIELTEEQKAKIEKRLTETTDYLSMEIIYKIDASLIGGVVIRIEDRVLDSSVKRQLERMSSALSQG